MNSRERIIAAVSFKTPDRTPTDLWLRGLLYRNNREAMDAMFAKHPIDIAYPELTMDELPPLGPISKPGTYTDDWGCVWENRIEGYMGVVRGYPLDNWSALDNWRTPIETLDAAVAAETAKHPDPGKFWLGWGGDFFHRMCWVRPMDKVLVDIAYGTKELYTLRDMLQEFFSRQVELVCKTDVDGIVFADDFGWQQQLLMSPKQWRDFIRPVYEHILGICKKAGKYIFFHSDGNISDIIEDFIELGVHALNSQLKCMDLKEVGKRYRGRITFWGEIDRQHIIPHGTPEDIYAAADEIKQHLATPEGGLIGQSEVDDLTPLKNVEAILTAWNR